MKQSHSLPSLFCTLLHSPKSSPLSLAWLPISLIAIHVPSVFFSDCLLALLCTYMIRSLPLFSFSLFHHLFPAGALFSSPLTHPSCDRWTPGTTLYHHHPYSTQLKPPACPLDKMRYHPSYHNSRLSNPFVLPIRILPLPDHLLLFLRTYIQTYC
ncbi:hypothetical protein BT96DRAFT_358154 [Gymnopus androsaceus JB14]|uniref:Uncharacterized protein n=1 Tax=Gymnopus androsaceus JB14 TaxID=1447944 RepID=A0A6A4I305_9AGAR|nr:hypothetical protein BT96DRAFT_358154 [Gymnopus androsaceus JB14]